VAILAGNGCVHSGATKNLIEFAERYHIPVATTARSKGVFPEDHSLSLGVFGLGGTLHATRALLGDEGLGICRPDVLLVLGARLNQNNTFLWSNIEPQERLIHVDIDPRALHLDDYADLPVVADIDTLLGWLRENPECLQSLDDTRSEREEWVRRIMPDRGPSRYDRYEGRTSNATPFNPARAIAELRQVAPVNCIMMPDSGSHTFFVYHHWESYRPRDFLIANTTGPMGWALAASLGVKLARPHDPCVVVTGDGCMLMHGMELQTAARYQIPILFVVINNESLGNVYLRAKVDCERSLNPERCRQKTETHHHWAKFAESLGIQGFRVERPQDLKATYEQAFSIVQGFSPRPVLIDILCDREIPPPNQRPPAHSKK